MLARILYSSKLVTLTTAVLVGITKETYLQTDRRILSPTYVNIVNIDQKNDGANPYCESTSRSRVSSFQDA